MIDLLAGIFVLGLAAAASATIVRALVPTLWLLVKPLSCDLCMSWWSSLILSVALTVSFPMPLVRAILLVLGAVTVSILALKIINRLSDLGLPPSE